MYQKLQDTHSKSTMHLRKAKPKLYEKAINKYKCKMIIQMFAKEDQLLTANNKIYVACLGLQTDEFLT